MLNFTYEDNIKIKNKHVAGVSRTYYLSVETISRPSKSRETIPLSAIQISLGIIPIFIRVTIPLNKTSDSRPVLGLI
jgi:hypothetical protein